MNAVIDTLAIFLLVVGCFFVFLGAFALVKLSSFFTRIHGPTKASTLGVGCILAASILYHTVHGAGLHPRELLITLFLFMTAPVSAHLMSRAALSLMEGRPGDPSATPDPGGHIRDDADERAEERARQAADRAALIAESTNRDILITSYDLLRRDLTHYEKLLFYCEVVDEAQFIKNQSTRAAHAVRKVAAATKIAMTGTPVENRLSELWSIFDYLMPGFLYGYKQFRDEMEIPIVEGKDAETLERLRRFISPFVLRRLKKDVLKDLPDKMEEVIYVQLMDEQKKIYQANVLKLRQNLLGKEEADFRKERIEILAALTRLRQLCCAPQLILEQYKGGSAKTDQCMDMLTDAVGNGHKVLVFSQFTSMLDILTDLARQQGIR